MMHTIKAHKRAAVFLTLALVLLIAFLTWFFVQESSKQNSVTASAALPIEPVHASYVDDADDLRALARISDYSVEPSVYDVDEVAKETIQDDVNTLNQDADSANAGNPVQGTSSNQNPSSGTANGDAPPASETDKNSSAKETKEPTVEQTASSYIVDMNDPRALTGVSDYVFVGRLLELTGTEYKYQDNFPFTNYKVEVLDDIKGELVKKTIEVQKEGGISADGKTYRLPSGDVMPKIGKIHIFLTKTRDDGGLSTSGMNTMVEIKGVNYQSDNFESLLSQIRATKEYIAHKDGFDNQIINPYHSNRSTRLSIYDVNAS